MVPMLTCGFERSNLAFATVCPPGLLGGYDFAATLVFRPVPSLSKAGGQTGMFFCRLSNVKPDDQQPHRGVDCMGPYTLYWVTASTPHLLTTVKYFGVRGFEVECKPYPNAPMW